MLAKTCIEAHEEATGCTGTGKFTERTGQGDELRWERKELLDVAARSDVTSANQTTHTALKQLDIWGDCKCLSIVVLSNLGLRLLLLAVLGSARRKE